MSTVGEKIEGKTQITQETAQQAASTRGSKGQAYWQAVNDLIISGEPVGSAIKQVASREGTTPSNVSNSYYRINRKVAAGGPGLQTVGRLRGAPSWDASDPRGAQKAVAVPKDLEPILDAIRKDRASLNSNIDQLVAWAQGQEEKTKTAVADAREVAIRQMREAAAGLK